MSESTPWPNRTPVVEGIVPTEEVPQDPDFLKNFDTDDNTFEMED